MGDCQKRDIAILTYIKYSATVSTRNLQESRFQMKRVCIIGTGFAASEIYRTLRNGDFSIEVIQPNLVDESLVSFDISQDSIFDEGLFEKNSKSGGGQTVWGHAITFPNNKNFFLQKRNQNIDWGKTGDKISQLDFGKVFGIEVPDLNMRKVLYENPNDQSLGKLVRTASY